MSYHQFYKQIDLRARRAFPSLEDTPVTWDHLVSPIELRLPKAVLEKVTRAVKALFALSRRPSYTDACGLRDFGSGGKNNLSVLMAYDFHTDENGGAYLVEINTNASGFLLAAAGEATHRDLEIKDLGSVAKLGDAFRRELSLAGKPVSPAHLGLIDEDLVSQKMYGEFVMYRDWFNSMPGWTAELADSADLRLKDDRLSGVAIDRSIDLVYNRTTDFYLEDPKHADLRRAFNEDRAIFSPNPREYALLADKQRLIEMTTPGFFGRAGATAEERAAIESVLIPTFERGAVGTPAEIWAKRRTLFFKPKNSYGGKSVYRGASVSKKVFERLMQDEILIQEYRPAQKVPVDDERSVLNNWKFDLRFYVYADEIQMAVARIYQGQVTNFASPMGGFTYVQFV